MRRHSGSHRTPTARKPAAAPAPDLAESLITPGDLARFAKVSPRTVERWRLRGGGPAFVLIARNVVRYEVAAVRAWLAARSRSSTSDGGAR
jgi:hypothetical protein